MIKELIVNLKFLRFIVVVLFLVLAFNFFFFNSVFINLIIFLFFLFIISPKILKPLKFFYFSGFNKFYLVLFKFFRKIFFFFDKKTNLLIKVELIKSSSFLINSLVFLSFFFFFIKMGFISELVLPIGGNTDPITLNLVKTNILIIKKIFFYIINILVFIHLFFGLQSLCIDYIFLPKRKSLKLKDYIKG